MIVFESLKGVSKEPFWGKLDVDYRLDVSVNITERDGRFTKRVMKLEFSRSEVIMWTR